MASLQAPPQGRGQPGLATPGQALMAGINFHRAGKLAEAAACYTTVLRVMPRNADALHMLGLVKAATGELDRGIELIQQAVQIQPKFAPAWFNLGNLLRKQNRLPETVAAYGRAVALDPKLAEAHCNLGGVLDALGRTEEAIAALRKAVTLNRAYAEAHYNLGVLLEKQGKLAECAAALRQAVAARADHAAAWRDLGIVCRRLGNLPEALAALRRAVASNRRDPNAWLNLGAGEQQAGALAAAADAYREAIALQPGGFDAHYQLGRVLEAQDRRDEAIDSYRRAIALDPQSADVLIDFARALLAKGKTDQALAAWRQAQPHASVGQAESLFLFARQLAQSQLYREALECMQFVRSLGQGLKHFVFFHGLMSALLGDLDEAVSLYAQAIAACCADGEQPSRYGSSAVPEYLVRRQPLIDLPVLLHQASSLDQAAENNADGLSPQAGAADTDGSAKLAQSLLEIEAENQLAENLVNYHGDYLMSSQVYQRRWARQNLLLQSCGIENQDTLFLNSDWTRNIGHIAYLGHLIKMRELGIAPWRKIVVLARLERIANPAYLDYWRKYLTVVTDPATIERFEPLTTACGFRFSTLLPFAGRESVATYELAGAVEARWEAQQRGALLSLQPDHEEAGWRALESKGMLRQDWFACLHVRETGYHGGDEQAHRNGDIQSYLPAVRSITERGGWVVRLGDSSMTPLPAMERVFDYPHSALKSARMDVFLAGACRFMIGTNSGMGHVPYSFGRPTVMANWVDTGTLPPFPRNGLFLPKLIFSEAESRLLSFREMLTAEWRSRSYSLGLLQKHRAHPVSNTAEEIDAAVVEMLERLDGTHVLIAGDDALRQKFVELLPDSARGASRMGAAFLRQHQALFG